MEVEEMSDQLKCDVSARALWRDIDEWRIQNLAMETHLNSWHIGTYQYIFKYHSNIILDNSDVKKCLYGIGMA